MRTWNEICNIPIETKAQRNEKWHIHHTVMVPNNAAIDTGPAGARSTYTLMHHLHHLHPSPSPTVGLYWSSAFRKGANSLGSMPWLRSTCPHPLPPVPPLRSRSNTRVGSSTSSMLASCLVCSPLPCRLMFVASALLRHCG